MRKKQLERHYFTHFTIDPVKMSDIPLAEARELVDALFPPVLEVVKELTGDAGQTIKTLYRLNDKALIESVLMFYPNRATLCVSCQVGCAMGCPFCATGMLGLTRNLTEREILEQVRLACLSARERGVKLTNLVFMGEGEPTQNLKAIFNALDKICTPLSSCARHVAANARSTQDPKQTPNFGLNARNVTISTVGNVAGIKALINDSRPFKLAISLHAPENVLRDKLVPMNKQFSLESVLDAGFAYFKAKGQRVSIEYALMKDINDSGKQAFTLAKILNRRGSGWAHVNAIGLNEVKGSPWTASTPEKTEAFLAALRSKGITATLRESRGQDIAGACGQLASDG